MGWFGTVVVGVLAGLLGWASPALADDSGEAVFNAYCRACHSLSEGVNRVGPHLAGVVGRQAGSVPGYAYSEANRNSGITWTEDKLDAYLENPQAVVPGTKMTFNGIRDAARRAALIAYLKTR